MPNETTYYYSSNLNSFPTTKMGSINKLITENSLTRLINRILDVDGFIITDGLAEKNIGSETIGNGGKHLKINDNIPISQVDFRDDQFEFVIRGYYFSINVKELTDLMDTGKAAQPGVTLGLYARIFIDKTNPNYPELVGQTGYEEESEENPKHYGVQFFVCQPGSKPYPYHKVLADSNTNQIDPENLGTNYLYYDLMLLKYIADDSTVQRGVYIPFGSLNKFDSHSQEIIDGGELVLF